MMQRVMIREFDDDVDHGFNQVVAVRLTPQHLAVLVEAVLTIQALPRMQRVIDDIGAKIQERHSDALEVWFSREEATEMATQILRAGEEIDAAEQRYQKLRIVS